MLTGPDRLARMKETLRRELLLRRAAAHAARAAAAGPALADRFVNRFSAALAGKTVSAYWPMRDEIDVRPLLAALSDRSVDCALPVMAGRDRPLEFRRWRNGDDMTAAVFGVSEPAPAAPPVTPDIVVVPLLGFDTAGNRLGYGGGYYDRTLTALRAAKDIVAVGVGYDEQEYENIPVDAGDAPLDVILTDWRTIVPGKKESSD